MRNGNLLFVAGHIAFQRDGTVLSAGKVGREVSGDQVTKQPGWPCLTAFRQSSAKYWDRIGGIPVAPAYVKREFQNMTPIPVIRIRIMVIPNADTDRKVWLTFR